MRDALSMRTLHSRFAHAALALSVLAAGCASAPIAVPVVGSNRAIGSLAGEWSGDYHGRESGRNGSISFRLQAGDTVAFGDVLMIPRDRERSGTVGERPVVAARMPALLTISFVRVADDAVSGMIEPYVDPDCDCMVITEFLGSRTSANELRGTFITRVVGGVGISSGRWSVKRTAPRSK